MIRKVKRESQKINTTALPDIIFMLLFFFMVTTVLQNEKIQEVNVPDLMSKAPALKKLTGSLVISSWTDGQFLVNNKICSADELVPVINTEKAKAGRIEKSLIFLDKETPMSKVNKLKEALQKAELYRVEYIHNMSLSHS